MMRKVSEVRRIRAHVQQMFLSSLFNLFHGSSSCCCSEREINIVYFILKYPRTFKLGLLVIIHRTGQQTAIFLEIIPMTVILGERLMLE